MSGAKPTFNSVSELVDAPASNIREFAARCVSQRLATRVDEGQHRVVLNIHRKYCSMDHALYRECNGVVVALTPAVGSDGTVVHGDDADSVSDDAAAHHTHAPADSAIDSTNSSSGGGASGSALRVVAYPAPAVNFRPKISEVRKNWNRYTQWPVVDGTALTLYYHGGKWCLASANGYDVMYMQWMGTRYGDALRELLCEYGVDLDRVNRTRNYHFIMRHHSMHPFVVDKQGLWLSQVCVGNTRVDTAADTAADTDIWGSDGGSRSANASDEIVSKIPHLQPLGKTHTYNYVVETNARALADYLANGTVHYGFILRADTDLGAETNVLLESGLMKKIRNYVYAAPGNRKDIPEYNQMKFAILRAYLDYTSRSNFAKLFPQFSPQLNSLKRLFANVADRVMLALRNESVRRSLGDSMCDRLARLSLITIDKMETVIVFDATSNSILHDIVVDARKCTEYYRIIYAGEDPAAVAATTRAPAQIALDAIPNPRTQRRAGWRSGRPSRPPGRW